MLNSKRNFPYPWLLLVLLVIVAACSKDHPTDPADPVPVLALHPEDGSVLTSDFVVNVGIDSIDSMAVFMDDTLLAMVVEPPFTLPVMRVHHGPGEHYLAVTVFDEEVQDHLAADILICFGVGLDVGNYAPSYSLEDMAGVTHSLRTSRGARVLLLDFWGSGCPPCIAALPETQRLFDEYGGKGLDVLTITGDSEGLVEATVLENDFTFPVLLDVNFMAHKIFNIWAIPTYFLIDHRGVVRYVYVGSGGRPLEEVILELL